jgi:hypothetical protein
MLIYEAEHFLEVESKEIQKLCRSTVAVPLGDTEPGEYAVQTVLCDYLNNSEQRCCIAFSDKITKSSLTFVVKGNEELSPWQYGQKILSQLGFQLEDVNLKFSPAMLDVILRDAHGILAPTAASKLRAEKSLLLAGFQRTYDEDLDGAQGKRAAFKLSAEKRRNAQSKEFRRVLESLFSSLEKDDVESAAHTSQIQELISKLESATALAEVERRQRQISEEITSAAEKRIQELEALLVDDETKSSKALKQSQKIILLQERIKMLEEKLDLAEIAVEKGREKQEQAIADAHAARERIALLERELKETSTVLENIQSHQAEELVEKKRLIEDLQESELRIETLDVELENAERIALQRDAEAKKNEDLRTQLAEGQQLLKETLEFNGSLQEMLAASNEQRDKLKESLCAAEKTVDDMVLQGDQKAALVEQNDELTGELNALRDKYEQECSNRELLEKRVEEVGRRIQELEDAHAQASSKASALSSAKKNSRGEALENAALRSELHEMNQRFKAEQQSREVLESEIDKAHQLIDALETMVREAESATREQRSHEVSAESENHRVRQLEDQLKTFKNHLEQNLIENKKLNQAVVVAEKKIAEQGELLVQWQDEQFERKSREAVFAGAVMQGQMPAKRLPHELRPAPKKGALFCPDWDLDGLPCKSSEQVFKAWEAVFNVQISLEGYQSQYCMVFLVVLRHEKQKSLYMLYRLQLSKHTLVCVPAKAPKDEASLKAAIKEGLNFLKMSGFEMDAMSEEHIAGTLGPYFLAD